MKYITAELREVLSQPLGKIVEVIPEGRKVWACVGDFSSRKLLEQGIVPKIVVFDLKTKREAVPDSEKAFFEGLERELIECVNPAGTITDSLVHAVEKAAKSKKEVKVFVDGEEDLAVLPLVEKAPFNSLVCYGQPGVGLVLIECSSQAKASARELMAKFEEEE